jgi:adenylate cyclase
VKDTFPVRPVAPPPPRPLALEDLSRFSGETPERLEKWRAAGLIGSESGLHTDDIGRARLVHELLHYGHSTEEIAQAFTKPDSVLQHFLASMAEQLARPMYSVQEAAEIVGLNLTTLREIVDATGMSDGGETLDDDDLDCLRSAKVALDAGYPQDALIQVLRVYSEAMRRAAEVSQRTSHFYVHQPAQSQYDDKDMIERLNETFSRIEPLVEPALLYFFRKGAMTAAWEDMLMHLEEEAGLEEKHDAPGQIRRAIMFVDLASFTPLAEAMGDIRAAMVLDRFADMVRRAVQRCHGRIVKQIGDGFMIVFPECFSAVSCGLELEERSSTEPQFPAIRVGLHWGPLLYREGDYVGSNVNIAARIADEAQRHQFLVTDEVRRRAKAYEGAEFVRLGRRRLKGLAAEVEVFEVSSIEPSAIDRVVDPVCKMEMGAREVVARLAVEGRDHAFCSEDCLRKFVKSPDKYIK